MRIIKTLYMTAKQCPKSLWLQFHKPETVSRDAINEGVLETGSMVGEAALGL